MKEKPSFLAGLFILCASSAAVIYTLTGNPLPDSIPASSPPEVFSAERAMVHLRFIAAEPHAAGSRRNAVVRDFITAQLRHFPYPFEIQKTVFARSYLPGVIFGASLENIILRIPSANNPRKNAVLLTCHYDSVPHGNGAGDNSNSCAGFLEAIRALHSQHDLQLKNDLIFLFSDAEETGLIGAAAFAERHRWMKDVRAVVDFEGRGNQGPSALFETGPGSGQMVKAYMSSIKYHRANSLTAAAYDLLPNDTDFTVFRRMAMPGLNFALFHGLPFYHTALDNPANIDLRSVQHQGDNIMASALSLGKLDLTLPPEDPGIYFDLGGKGFFQYSILTGRILGIFTLLLLAAIFIGGGRSIRLSFRKTVSGLLLALLLILTAAGVTYLFLKVMSLRLDSPAAFFFGEPYNGVHYRAVIMIIPGLIVLLFLSQLHRFRLAWTDLSAGALFILCLLLALSLIWMPGASFFFQWPLLCGLLAFYFTAQKDVSHQSMPALIFCLPVILIGADNFPEFLLALSARLGAPLTVPMTLYWLCLLPLLVYIRKNAEYLAAVVLFALLFSALTELHRSGGYTASLPRQNTLMYLYNSNTNKARFASCDLQTDDWTRTFFPDDFRAMPDDFFPIINSCILTDKKFLLHSAPNIPHGSPDTRLAVPPSIYQVQRIQKGAEATLNFRLQTGPLSAMTVIFIKGMENKRAPRINGSVINPLSENMLKQAHRAITQSLNLDKWTIIRFQAAPAGLSFEIPVKNGPVEILVVDVVLKLPVFPSMPVRPVWTVPAPNFFPSDAVYTSRSFSFQ